MRYQNLLLTLFLELHVRHNHLCEASENMEIQYQEDLPS